MTVGDFGLSRVDGLLHPLATLVGSVSTSEGDPVVSSFSLCGNYSCVYAQPSTIGTLRDSLNVPLFGEATYTSASFGNIFGHDRPASPSIVAASGDALTHDFVYAAWSRVVSGTGLDSFGTPAADAAVHVYFYSGWQVDTTTDDAGEWSVTGPQGGGYVWGDGGLHFAGSGYSYFDTSPAPVVALLFPSALVVGRVVDSLGAPLVADIDSATTTTATTAPASP